MHRDDVERLISRWDQAVVTESDATDWWAATGVPRSSTVLHEPATPDAIAALEQRIGRRLPPSVRQFLECSDGAEASVEAVDEPGEGLSRAAQIGWFADAVPALPHLEPLAPPKGWSEPGSDAPQSELGSLIDAFVEGSSDALSDHLVHCLALSPLRVHTAVLLNPLVRDVDGEWQCIDFDTHGIPRAYRSFAAFLESRIATLVARAARVERCDDDDLTTVDDATIARWLSSYGVAPAWFGRLVRSEDPPRRLVDAMTQLVGSTGSRARGAVLLEASRMRGDAAVEVARAAWRFLEGVEAEGRAAGLPMGPAAMEVITRLGWTGDDRVREWVVDTLAESADRPLDGRVEASLSSLAPAVVEALRARPAAAPLVDVMVSCGRWLGPDDLLRRARRWATDLEDVAWRAASSTTVPFAIEVVARGGEAMLPVLRRLRGADGVPQDRLAAELLALGDDDLEFAARHLSLIAAARAHTAPPAARDEHRRLRIAVLAAGGDLARDPAELLLAGLEHQAADVVLARAVTRPAGESAFLLERQRTTAAADALATLSRSDPHALRSLARLGDQRCVSGLVDHLRHDDPEARRFAARGLRELGEPASIAHLVARAEHDDDDDVAWIASHAALLAGVDATALLERLEAMGEQAARVVAYWRVTSDDHGATSGPVPS